MQLLCACALCSSGIAPIQICECWIFSKCCVPRVDHVFCPFRVHYCSSNQHKQCRNSNKPLPLLFMAMLPTSLRCKLLRRCLWCSNRSSWSNMQCQCTQTTGRHRMLSFRILENPEATFPLCLYLYQAPPSVSIKINAAISACRHLKV